MKYAVISDVHANLEALQATLSRIDAEGVDQILCLGDVVGYHADPNECLALVRSRSIRCIAGNHDRAAAGLKEPDDFGEAARRAILWTRTRLTPEGRAWLAALPLTWSDERCLLVHGALHPQPNEDLHLSSLARAERSLAALRRGFSVRLCFFGHTHRPVVYRQRGRAVDERRGEPGLAVPLEGDDLYLVNPGSVGQPRDGDRRASFALFDSDRAEIRFLRVPYAWEACRAKAEREGLLHREGALLQTIHRVEGWLRHGKEELGRRLR